MVKPSVHVTIPFGVSLEKQNISMLVNKMSFLYGIRRLADEITITPNRCVRNWKFNAPMDLEYPNQLAIVGHPICK